MDIDNNKKYQYRPCSKETTFCTCDQFLEVSTKVASVAVDIEGGEEDDERDGETQKLH